MNFEIEIPTRPAYTIDTVYVGHSGHLRRFKVLDADGKYVPGGLFKTWEEAEDFIAGLSK